MQNPKEVNWWLTGLLVALGIGAAWVVTGLIICGFILLTRML